MGKKEYRGEEELGKQTRQDKMKPRDEPGWKWSRAEVYPPVAEERGIKKSGSGV